MQDMGYICRRVISHLITWNKERGQILDHTHVFCPLFRLGVQLLFQELDYRHGQLEIIFAYYLGDIEEDGGGD